MRPNRLSICTIGAPGHGKSTLVRAILEHLDPGYLEREAATKGNFQSRYFDFATRAKKYNIQYNRADDVAKSFCESLRYDGVLLVVSAADGVTAETRKHVWLAKWFGVPMVVPFLNKSDLISQQGRRLQMQREIQTLLYRNGFRCFDLPVVCGSAIGSTNSGPDGIQPLLDVLDRTVFSRYGR